MIYVKAKKLIETFKRNEEKFYDYEELIIAFKKVSTQFIFIQLKSEEDKSRSTEKRKNFTMLIYKKRAITIKSGWIISDKNHYEEKIKKIEFKKVKAFLEKVFEEEFHYRKGRF